MAKRSQSLVDRLDQAVQALLARPDAPVRSKGAELEGLLHIAADLRDLPREEFRARLKADLERRALMTTTAVLTREARHIPEGYHTATPRLIVRDASGAIEFYKKAFGATELMRLKMPDGRIGHAEIRIGDSRIMIADDIPEYGHRSPQSLGGSPVVIYLYVEDVDAVARQAVAAGAKLLIPVSDQFYGDRSGRLADPFGHIWIISTHKEDVSAEEMQKRLDALMKQQGASVEPEEATKAVEPALHTITPYLTAREAPELIAFVKQAFGAEELHRATGSAGGIHCSVRIGASTLMIGGGPMPGGGEWRHPPNTAAIHLYVKDADAVYRRALEAGAISLQEPVDQPYGDREAGVKDAAGNYWYIATHKATGHIPEGLRDLTPFLHPSGADKLIDFLKHAFGAEEAGVYRSPEGTIAHAQVRIGDSVVEMGEAHGEFQPMPSMFYVYMENVDAVYQRALEAGATSIEEPLNTPYGHRRAGVKDPFGNDWYIAMEIKRA